MFSTVTTVLPSGLISVAFGFHEKDGTFTCTRPSRTFKSQAGADRAISAWASR